jgi:hypothetical protein
MDYGEFWNMSGTSIDLVFEGLLEDREEMILWA